MLLRKGAEKQKAIHRSLIAMTVRSEALQQHGRREGTSKAKVSARSTSLQTGLERGIGERVKAMALCSKRKGPSVRKSTCNGAKLRLGSVTVVNAILLGKAKIMRCVATLVVGRVGLIT